MGFLKKAFRGVGKVLKKGAGVILPAIGTAVAGPIGAAIGSAVGGIATKAFGNNDYTAGIGSSVSDAISGSISNSINGSQVQAPQMPQGGMSGGFTDGVNFIKGMETPIKSAGEQGQDTRDYLAAAYPEMNPWERAGTGGTMFGSDMTGAVQEQELANKRMSADLQMQGLNMQKELALAQLQSETQLAINANNNATSERVAGIASQTSRMNTRDQVNIGQQNVDMANKRLSYDIQKIQADTSLSEQQKKESIARTIKTQAEANNVSLSADQIVAYTNQLYAQTKTEGERTKLTKQQTDNARYGQGFLPAQLNSGANAAIDFWNSPFSGKGQLKWLKDAFTGSDGIAGAMGRFFE